MQIFSTPQLKHQGFITVWQDGFTFIEILIAIAVLSIGLLSLTKMQISAIHNNAKSNNLMQRTTIASNHMERLLNKHFDDPDLTDMDNNNIGNHGNIHDPENDGLDNDGDGSIDEADDDGEADYKITWKITGNNENSKIISLTVTGNHYGATTSTTINTIRVR